MRFIMCFLGGATLLGIPYFYTLGELSAMEIKYSIALDAACSDKDSFEAFLDSAATPVVFEQTVGDEHWEQAKENILADCVRSTDT